MVGDKASIQVVVIGVAKMIYLNRENLEKNASSVDKMGICLENVPTKVVEGGGRTSLFQLWIRRSSKQRLS